MYCSLLVYLRPYLIALDRDTIGSLRLRGVIYMFSGHSSKSLVNPPILLQAFHRVTSNVILAVNTRDETLVWAEKEREIKQQFLTLRPLDLPLYHCFDNLASALKIVDQFLQDDRVDARLVWDKTRRSFSFACTLNNWYIIEHRTVRNAIYKRGSGIDSMVLTATQRATEEIMDWLVGKTAADVNILWLYGIPGVGKSTLAKTVAYSCHSQNLLLATFFFLRMDATCNTIHPLVVTILDQIGNAIPPAKELIMDAVGDQSIFSAPFGVQLSRLVLQPLLRLGVSNFPRIIIIDALDECLGPDMQSEVVEGIVASRQTIINTKYPLRFLIFSRPEGHLRKTFALVPNSMIRRIKLDPRWFSFGDFSAPRAIHNSKDRYDPPKCHPDTRVAIRDRLMEWATQTAATTKDSGILWFYGGPGTGKSAVAQTLAETLQSQNLLLATFFFSRTDSTRNTTNPLAITISFQIGTVVPDLRESILDVLDNNPRLLNEPFEAQLINLVLRPLAEFTKDNMSPELLSLMVSTSVLTKKCSVKSSSV